MRQFAGKPATKRPSRHKPPSRVRYEVEHPTVSFRVPGDVYQRLRQVKEAEGKSLAEILKVGLGLLEAGARSEAEVLEAGYVEGWTQAERTYKVTYACNVCGETVAVDSADARKAAGRYLEEQRWGHKRCHERRRQGRA